MTQRDSLKIVSLEMLLLYLLQEGDYYGYQLSQLIKERSESIIVIPEGSMYPTLYRLADKGYLTYEKKQVGKRLKRVYYHLETSGKEYLAELIENYRMFEKGINLIFDEKKDN